MSLPATKNFQFRAHAVSDVGCVRQNNEDAWAIRPEFSLYVLADGMGGHQAGEVASNEAIAAFCRAFQEPTAGMSIEEVASYADRAVQLANNHVYRLSRKSYDRHGMGTTLCALKFHGGSVVIINVGDSRIYRIRSNKLYGLTADHSLRRELLDSGCFDERDIETISCKHVLTKAIGTTKEIDPTIVIQPVFSQDIFLLCSDGLTDMLSDSEIEEVLALPRTLEERVRTLVANAKDKGGIDNITVILVEAL